MLWPEGPLHSKTLDVSPKGGGGGTATGAATGGAGGAGGGGEVGSC